YKKDFQLKTRTIYSSLPRLAPTLRVLYQSTHPTNDAAEAFYDPTAKENVIEGDGQNFDGNNDVLMYVLSKLSIVPDIPYLGPGFEERAKQYLDAVKKFSPDHPLYKDLQTSPYNREKTWSEALHRIFNTGETGMQSLDK